jgi:hypothetical protein
MDLVAYDRQGNRLTRRGGGGSHDPFKIPDDLKEQDWDYQWIRTSTYGQEDVSNQVNMGENGWRPIQADRPNWRGRFMPADYKGVIVKDGLMLVERPMLLTEQAKAEHHRDTSALTRQQREQFGLSLPNGFEKARVGHFKGNPAPTGVRVGRTEAAPPDLAPRHELADGMEY